MSDMKKVKVLIIEGGGAFGLIPAFFCSTADKHGLWDLDKVDSLSGCSIGGILALAYACSDKSNPQECYKFFEEHMEDCFDKRFIARINPLANPTYTNKGIDTTLEGMFKTSVFGDIRKDHPNLNVIIPALNITDNSYKVYDNIRGKDDNYYMKDIAEDTSCAPSYYAGRDRNGKCMIDGGLIEVAPLLTTVTALKGKLGWPFLSMDVFMIGCGNKIDSKHLTTKEYNSLSMLGIATDVLKPYATLSNSLATLYWGSNMGFNSFTYWNPVDIKGDLDDLDMPKKCIQDYKDIDEDWECKFINAWSKWLNE